MWVDRPAPLAVETPTDQETGRPLPLLPLLARDGRLFVLALSEDEAQLLYRTTPPKCAKGAAASVERSPARGTDGRARIRHVGAESK